MTEEFRVSEEALDAGRHVIAARGELDLLNSAELEQRLRDAILGGKTRIVVDLTETTYMSETGLDVLYKARQKVRARGGALVIVNIDANIAKVFEITALDQLFTIRDTREGAIAALDTAAS